MNRRSAWAQSVAAATASLLYALPVWGSYTTVFGSPVYIGGIGGYRNGDVPVHPGVGVNNCGAASGRATKYDAAGKDLGSRAVRWDAVGNAIELGNLGSQSSGFGNAVAYALNDVGIVVGLASKFTSSGSSRGTRAVRWESSGSPTELGVLGLDASGRTNSFAYAVSSGGTAVGWATKYDQYANAKGDRAVRWDASGTVATELGNLGVDVTGTTTSYPFGINAVGSAVGYARKFDAGGADIGTRAVRWNADSSDAIELGNLGLSASGTTTSYAYAINKNATAVGFATKYVGPGYNLGYRAVRWDPLSNDAIELGNLGTDSSGFTLSYAYSVNSSGLAVGTVTKYDNSATAKGVRAVRWGASNTDATELGILGTSASGSTDSYAYMINHDGVSVGYVNKYDNSGNPVGQRAVCWGLDNIAIDLNTLIDPGNGWVLKSANAISDSGWISGVGSFDPDGPRGQAEYTRLFLLHVPEPASLSGIAGVFALMLRRRIE